MFKVSHYALAAALLAEGASLASACEGIISKFTGECTYQNFIDNLDASCNATELFPDGAEAEVAELCAYDAPVHFVEAQGTYQKDRRYFAGGGIMSDGDPAKRALDLSNLIRFDANRQGKSIINFPEYAARFDYNSNTGRGQNGYPANMNLETSCGLKTMMCCFADKNEGETFPSTTDVCHHDLHDSPQSNHIEEGWSIFPSDSAPQPHCVGFTWDDGDAQEELLGNILYDISVHQTLHKGYIHSIPGAPMCGCVEHMPAVEKADCKTAEKTGETTYQFSYLSRLGYVTADNFATVTLKDCANTDLATQYKSTKVTQDEKDLINEHLVGVGQCALETEEYLNSEQFLLERQVDTKYITPDPAAWEGPIVGEGIYYLPPVSPHPEVSDAAFRALIDAGCTGTDENGTVVPRKCIVRRVCPSCSSAVHRDVYYQRHTDLPPFGTNRTAGEVYFLDLFMNNWYSYPNNARATDFDLYSTYEDAIADENEWLYCNYNHHRVGFPRDCGPRGYVGNQWNSFTRHGATANDHAWYVEKP